jgi:transmembrane sensor
MFRAGPVGGSAFGDSWNIFGMTHDHDLELIRQGVAAARGDTTPSAEDTVASLHRLHARLLDIEGRPGETHVTAMPEHRLRQSLPEGNAHGASRSSAHVRGVLPWRLDGREALRTWTTRVAGGVLALLTIGFVAQWATAHFGASSTIVRYATSVGERLQIALPDSSRVVLAPESRLTYATGARGARTVTLSGQAHFTVTHDTRRPFTVRTGTIQTRVLGTAFDVRHYTTDTMVRVVVVDGKVAMRGRDGRSAPVLLVAGTEGQLTDSTAVIVTNRNTDEAEAWTRGRLVFDDTPVPDMLRTLQRWYGYEFRLTDSVLARQQVTARFSIGDTVNTMADLKVLLGVTMQFDGSIVTLSPVRHPSRSHPQLRRKLYEFPSQSEVGK